MLECSGPGLPVGGAHSTLDHRLVKGLFSRRAELGPRLAQLALPKVRTFEVPLPHGHRAQVQLLLPPSWREELRDAAYPVLVHMSVILVLVLILLYHCISNTVVLLVIPVDGSFV